MEFLQTRGRDIVTESGKKVIKGKVDKKTGKEISFVPAYLAPSLKKIVFGKAIRYDGSAPAKAERDRISGYLKEEITRTAESLPRHRVVPYRNIPKKDYPWSRPEEKR